MQVSKGFLLDDSLDTRLIFLSSLCSSKISMPLSDRGIKRQPEAFDLDVSAADDFGVKGTSGCNGSAKGMGLRQES